MFRKTRRKIVASVMGALFLLFAVTLSVIVLSSLFEARKQSKEMLEFYTDQYSLEAPPREPGNRPPSEMDGPPGKAPLYELSTFYSVALSDSGEVLAIDAGRMGIYSEDDLVRIAKEIRENNTGSGHTSSLTYKVAEKNGYTLIAFVDTTITDDSFHSLVKNTLIIGAIAIAVCFILADYLAYRIVKPLEENDKKQRQFISDAGHELKTPLAVISSNAEVLSRQIGDNEWLDNICYENDRMGELVTQLLDLSRAENSDTPIEAIDLSRVATGEILAFESLAFDQGKTIKSDITDEIHISGSQSQLAQLVAILLDNAIRHSTGSEIDVSLKTRGHTALLSVSNDGEPIPPEKQEHLFDRFYRIDEARNSEGQHYGLGLAIARAVAEKHGGSIGVSCHDGKVTFTVSLQTQKA